jgi:tetratricopeptide (TPR) repeat protein
MAIEGPLRELGIHDVFQLLDLSRKTGALRVTSELRDNEGTVFFDSGKVVYATIRSNPHPLGAMLVRSGKVSEADLERALQLQAQRKDGQRFGQILVEMGAITVRELERQVKLQVEAVIFELMSWREGFFSFGERDVSDVPVGYSVRISTESLLMEGARRIDEWSRIADKVPNLAVVPVLAAVGDDHASGLDLLPNEWEMLATIDGERDLRSISAELGRSEFDVAKITYGLLSTGVVELRMPQRVSVRAQLPVVDAEPHVARAVMELANGHPEAGLAAAREAISADPSNAAARYVAGRALLLLGRPADATEELRRAQQTDPGSSEVALELAYAAAFRGEFDEALDRWRNWLAEHPEAEKDAERVHAAMDMLTKLRATMRLHLSQPLPGGVNVGT